MRRSPLLSPCLPQPRRALWLGGLGVLLALIANLGAQSPTSVPASPALAAVSPAPTATAPVAASGAEATNAEAPASTPQPEPKTMEAAFDFSQGVILLDVDLSGGHIFKFAFDTGDEANVMDLELAKEIKVPFEKLLSIPAGQKGPDISTQQIDIVSAHVGDADFPHRPFMILPIAADLKAMGIDCRGTIGYRFFQDRVVQIDYPAHKLRVLETMPAAPEGAVVLPISWMKYDQQGIGVTTVNALKIGDHTLTAQFDTLFSRTLLLLTPKLPWLETTRLPDLPDAFYEGGILRPALATGTLGLGNYQFPHPVPVYLADRDARQPVSDIAAVLGNGFFLDAVVTLDYKQDKMMVEWRK